MRNEPVYRRRRAAAVVLLLVVIVVIVLVVKALATPSSGATPAGSPKPSVTAPSTAPSATNACDPAQLDLSVALDGNAFAVGSAVQLVVTVGYHGEQPCLINGSDVARAVVITSGADRIWSSADCADQDERMLLLAKGDVDRKTITWSTERSEPGCTKNLPAVKAGTYKVQTTLDKAKSKKVVFTLQ